MAGRAASTLLLSAWQRLQRFTWRFKACGAARQQSVESVTVCTPVWSGDSRTQTPHRGWSPPAIPEQHR